MVFQRLAIEEPTEILSSRLGDAASMLHIPGLDLTFYFNHVRNIEAFALAFEQMQQTD